MAPNPTKPTVRPPNSPIPSCRAVSVHTPARRPWSKAGIRRSTDNIRPKASSATARALVPGRLQTGMPRRFAASRSMVFTPTPIFWISFSRGAASIIASVQRSSTCHSTSQSGSNRTSESASFSGQTATSSPGSAANRAARSGPAAAWKTTFTASTGPAPIRRQTEPCRPWLPRSAASHSTSPSARCA